MKGSRVQGIVRELSGERIDIVPFSEDPIAFVTKALSPAKILQTIPDDENQRMRVIVTEDQLSLAIGKSGQNARLAAKLTGWEIDLVSEEEFAASRGETRRSDSVPVENLEGLGPKTVENLIQSGFESVQDIVKATMEDLVNVPGIGDVTAQKIYLAAVQHLEAVAEEKARLEMEAAETPEAAEATEAVEATDEAADSPEAVPAAAPSGEAQEAADPAPPAAATVETSETAVDEVEEPALSEPVESSAAESAAAAEESEPESVPEPEEAPTPSAETAEKPKRSGDYLDDIEAMESELTSGWEEPDGKPKKGVEKESN
jgi:N utilization substance protein A